MWTTKSFLFLVAFFWAAVLQETPIGNLLYSNELLFGFLPGDYFTLRSVGYGFLGNSLYSLILIMQRLLQLSEGEQSARPFNKYDWFLLGLRPVVAGIFSLVLTAILLSMADGKTILNVNLAEAEGFMIFTGLFSGLFFEFLTTREFMKKVFKRTIEDKV